MTARERELVAQIVDLKIRLGWMEDRLANQKAATKRETTRRRKAEAERDQLKALLIRAA